MTRLDRILFCPSCGKPVLDGHNYCSTCGKPIIPTSQSSTRQPYYYSPGQTATPPPSYQPVLQQVVYVNKKDEGIAAVLSFLFLGLGQIYNGEIARGVGFILLGVAAVGFAFLSAVSLAFVGFFLVGFIIYPILWIYNVYDAYTGAKMINRRNMHKMRTHATPAIVA